MSDACTFCRITRGDLDAHVVFDSDVSLAFLDHRPLFHGHCLLVPKDHVETLVDLPPALVAPFFTHAQLLARAVEEGLQADGSFIAINNRVSQSVPHLHVHIVPRRKNDGMKGFFWPRHPYKDEVDMAAVQQTLQKTIDQLLHGEGRSRFLVVEPK
ncbi:MAG TPA: HIT family protein [Nitrospiraceae bacterium]|nr:HIT family protein [Nitrospiraceae bacterium]